MPFLITPTIIQAQQFSSFSTKFHISQKEFIYHTHFEYGRSASRDNSVSVSMMMMFPFVCDGFLNIHRKDVKQPKARRIKRKQQQQIVFHVLYSMLLVVIGKRVCLCACQLRFSHIILSIK